jgi:hypothetical protein
MAAASAFCPSCGTAVWPPTAPAISASKVKAGAGGFRLTKRGWWVVGIVGFIVVLSIYL